jgi:hypothetical protein
MEFLMKNVKIIIIVFIVIIITGCSYIDKIKMDKYLETYEIIVGRYHGGVFSGKHVLYGYKNNELIEIDDTYPRDQSNFKRIVGTDDLITYFDYDTWYQLYTDMDRAEYGKWGVDQEHKNLLLKYYNNYNYDSKDKEVFDNMVKNVLEKHKYNASYYDLKYFFIVGDNYYLFMYENNEDIMYQYDNTTDTLIKLFVIPLGDDLEYFNARKK